MMPAQPAPSKCRLKYEYKVQDVGSFFDLLGVSSASPVQNLNPRCHCQDYSANNSKFPRQFGSVNLDALEPRPSQHPLLMRLPKQLSIIRIAKCTESPAKHFHSILNWSRTNQIFVNTVFFALANYHQPAASIRRSQVSLEIRLQSIGGSSDEAAKPVRVKQLTWLLC